MAKKPKVLLFDIETIPNMAYIWGKFDQTAIAFEKEWELLCYAYKWYGQKKTYFHQKTGRDDGSLCKSLWKLLDKADLVIAHNAKKFDIKKTNARFIQHGLTPPSPYAIVDTLVEAKKYFKFTSNRLTDLGKNLGLGEKVETGGFQLWLDCMAGKQKAWNKMKKYNIQDINLLEAVYKVLKPWIVNHPNMSLLRGKVNCPSCDSIYITKQGTKVTNKTVQQQYKCKDCLGWFSLPKRKTNAK